MGPDLGYPNAVIVSEDGDGARHGDMRPKGEEVGILLVNVGSARRENYDVITHLHPDVLQMCNVGVRRCAVPLHDRLAKLGDPTLQRRC